MSTGESSFAICSSSSAFKKAIKHDKAGSDRNNAHNYEDISDHGGNNGHIMFGEVKLEMLIATHAEYFLSLDNLGRETVAMHDTGWTWTSLDELWCYP